MNNPISKDSAVHYVWGTVCDGWRLVDQPGLSVIEERVPVGASETRHYHSQARQFFYVLSGDATLEVEGVEHNVSAGTGLEVRPGDRHRFTNRGPVAVTFLVISSPSTIADRIEIEPLLSRSDKQHGEPA